MPPQNQGRRPQKNAPIPIEMPLPFLRPFAKDTGGWVKPCYHPSVKVDRYGNQTPDWVQLKISGMDGLNPGLLLNKFCPDVQALKEKKKFFFAGWKELADKQPAGHAKALIQRRVVLLDDLWKDQGIASQTLTGTVVWRMVIGFGNPNPLETSLTLHPQYGIPLIPGSAVKGLTRHGRLLDIGSEVGVYPLPLTETEEPRKKREPTPLDRLERLLLAVEEEDRKKTLAALQSDSNVLKAITAADPPHPVTGQNAASLLEGYAENFRRAFGTTQNQGEVVFLDALPLPDWTYELDVMTPHYGDYYQKEAPPADWLEPTPIPFLTIGQGSRFRFDVFGKDDALLGEVMGWLEKVLSEFGAGGKTSAGYGEIETS